MSPLASLSKAVSFFELAFESPGQRALQSEICWVLLFQVQVLKVGVPNVQFKLLFLREKLQVLRFLPIMSCDVEVGVGVLVRLCPSHTYPLDYGPSLICQTRSC